jgi:hypothetical protein
MDTELAPGQVRAFRENGFLTLDSVTTDDELAWLRQVYDEIVEDRIGFRPVQLRSGVWPYRSLLTLLSPEADCDHLKETQFARVSSRIVRQLYDADRELLMGWRLFLKPAGAGPTPWHQDAVYRPPAAQSRSVWMPLDAATPESSCMLYIRGSHLNGVRIHDSHDDHLTTDEFDPDLEVACPLAAGGAAIHHCRTVHGTSPNSTRRARRAIAIVFSEADPSA